MRFSDRIIIFLFCLYFILKPFYFWSSGLPQISDFVLLLMTIFYLIKNKFRIRFYNISSKFICTNLGFVLYVLFINVLWSLLLNGELEFFTTSAFYVYNFIASFMVLMLYREYGDNFYKYMYISVLLSTFIQLTIYLAGGGFDGTRVLVSFNNPNQLGYHNLLVLGFLIATSQRQKLKPFWFILSIIATLILCFSSLSKAAIISYSGLLVLFLFIRIMTKKSKKRSVIYLVIIILILLITCYSNRGIITSNQLYKSVMYRISSIGSDGDDNLSRRGYDRLTNYPEYLIFGSGEGEFSRFGDDIEFHSTLGNILMSYGIIGLFLFLASIMFAIKNDRWIYTYIIFFILLYGLTHNGIRNTLLWMLIALISMSMYPKTIEEINLIELLLIIRKRLWIIALITILCTGTSGLINYYVLEPEYQTYTTLMIGRPKEYNQDIEYADLLLNKKLISTYKEIAKSRRVANEFMSNLGLGFSYDELDKKIDVTIVNDTNIIKIFVKDKDGEVAAYIANEFANVFIKHIVEIMEIENIQVIDRAEIPLKPYKPKKVTNMLITSFLGIMLSIFAVFIHAYFDNTIKTADDIEKNLDLSIFGVIPKVTLS